MFGLVEAKPVEISDPAVVRFSFPIFNLGNEQPIYWITGQVFRQVEWVDSSAFGIAKHVDRQVILMFDVWNLVEWGGKFYACEVEFVLMVFILRDSLCVFLDRVTSGE